MVTEIFKEFRYVVDNGDGLNPYCVGLWSLSIRVSTESWEIENVLILIVLDYGH